MEDDFVNAEFAEGCRQRRALVLRFMMTNYMMAVGGVNDRRNNDWINFPSDRPHIKIENS